MFSNQTTRQEQTCIHCSLLISTPLARREVMALSMIFSTIWVLPLASSNLAAVIQIWRSVGMFSRALFRTRRAFSYVSKRASANHSYEGHTKIFRHRESFICCIALGGILLYEFLSCLGDEVTECDKCTSTLVGQHSTALLSMILASSCSSSSTAVFHSRTDFDTFSRATWVTITQLLSHFIDNLLSKREPLVNS